MKVSFSVSCLALVWAAEWRPSFRFFAERTASQPHSPTPRPAHRGFPSRPVAGPASGPLHLPVCLCPRRRRVLAALGQERSPPLARTSAGAGTAPPCVHAALFQNQPYFPNRSPAWPRLAESARCPRAPSSGGGGFRIPAWTRSPRDPRGPAAGRCDPGLSAFSSVFPGQTVLLVFCVFLHCPCLGCPRGPDGGRTCSWRSVAAVTVSRGGGASVAVHGGPRSRSRVCVPLLRPEPHPRLRGRASPSLNPRLCSISDQHP